MLFAGLTLLTQTSYAAKTNEIGHTLTINTENSPTNWRMDVASQGGERQRSTFLTTPLDSLADRMYKHFEKVYPLIHQQYAANPSSRDDIQLDFGPTMNRAVMQANPQEMHLRLNP